MLEDRNSLYSDIKIADEQLDWGKHILIKEDLNQHGDTLDCSLSCSHFHQPDCDFFVVDVSIHFLMKEIPDFSVFSFSHKRMEFV